MKGPFREVVISSPGRHLEARIVASDGKPCLRLFFNFADAPRNLIAPRQWPWRPWKRKLNMDLINFLKTPDWALYEE